MQTTLGKLKYVISEVLEANQVLNRLRAVAAGKKPYMVGQWATVPRDYSQPSVGVASCWVAEDPELGKVYLTFSSHITYKKVKNSRLRDPGGTRYAYTAILSSHPWETFENHGNVPVFKLAATGEGREDDKALQARKQMVKLFGVDPMAHRGPLEPTETRR